MQRQNVSLNEDLNLHIEVLVHRIRFFGSPIIRHDYFRVPMFIYPPPPLNDPNAHLWENACEINKTWNTDFSKWKTYVTISRFKTFDFSMEFFIGCQQYFPHQKVSYSVSPGSILLKHWGHCRNWFIILLLTFVSEMHLQQKSKSYFAISSTFTDRKWYEDVEVLSNFEIPLSGSPEFIYRQYTSNRCARSLQNEFNLPAKNWL